MNILFWCWFLMVIILSVIPKTPKSEITAWGLEFRIDYAEHLLVYLILGMLFIMKMRQKNYVDMKNLNKYFYYVLFIVFAIACELVQKLVPGRTFNPNDMYYNVGGIFLGLITTEYYFNKLKKNITANSIAK